MTNAIPDKRVAPPAATHAPAAPPPRLSGSQWLALAIAIALCGHLLLTSTVSLHQTLWKYDVKRMAQLGLLPLIFLAVLLHPPLRRAFSAHLAAMPRWLGVVLLAIAGLGLLSSAVNSRWGVPLLYSLADVFLLLLVVVAALCVAACRRVAGAVFDRTALLLLAMLSVAVGLQELLGVVAAWSSGLEFNPVVALLHFSWPRFYNQVQSWSLPVIAALPLVMPRKPLVTLLCLLALALGWYVIIASGGRGSAVAVSGAVLAAALLLPTARRALLAWHVAGLLLGGLLYALVLAGHGVILQPAPPPSRAAQPPAAQPTPRAEADGAAAAGPAGEDSGGIAPGRFLAPVTGARMLTSSGRTAMWRGTLRDTRHHPLLGIGPMNYACKGPLYRAAHPHSFPMQFMSEWGIAAFSLLLLALAYLAWRAFARLRNLSPAAAVHPALPTALATGVLAAAIHACLSGVLIMPASQVCGMLISGWFIALMVLPSGPPDPAATASTRQRRWSPGPPLLAAALLIALAFVAFAGYEITTGPAHLEQTPELDRLIPRLWQNGKRCAIYYQGAGG